VDNIEKAFNACSSHKFRATKTQQKNNKKEEQLL